MYCSTNRPCVQCAVSGLPLCCWASICSAETQQYCLINSHTTQLLCYQQSSHWNTAILCLIAKLRRTYPCGNVKSNCNFVFHNGERKEITWERKRAQVVFKDVQMVQTLERKERTGRENRQTAIRVHNHITFRVWHVISFLSPLWKTKLQLDFTLPQG